MSKSEKTQEGITQDTIEHPEDNKTVVDGLVIIDDPGYGLPSRNVRYTIAKRLQHYLMGRVAGKKGYEPTSRAWDKGHLTAEEAVLVVDFALSMGVNPFTDVHVWYYRGLQMSLHYRIMAGWAQLREPFTATYRPIEEAADRQRHNMQDGDIGVVCYILKRSAQDRWQNIFQTIIQAQAATGKMNVDEAMKAANDAACVKAVGIVRREEMHDKNGEFKPIQVTGWSWSQRAQTRAFRNAVGISHGRPTAAEIAGFKSGLIGVDTRSKAFAEVLANEKYEPSKEFESIQFRTLVDKEERRTVEEVANILRGEEEDGID